MKDLSPAERRALRARAHSLNPVVIVGNDGLTPGVTAEVERSLKAHELIKIRVGGMEHAERESVCESICGQTGAALVQHIGKVLVIYRQRPAESASSVPRKPRKKALQPGGGRPRPAPTARRASAKTGAKPKRMSSRRTGTVRG